MEGTGSTARKRVAVVGAGISGLTAAHLLHRVHEVTVFEAEARPGGHAHTIRVDTPDATHYVDTGFVVFNDRNYPLFERLLSRLGVESQRSNMSMSVTSESDDFEYASTSVNGVFAKRTHVLDPEFRRMVRDVRRFQREAAELLAPGAEDDISLGHYLENRGYSRMFIDRLLIPQASAVWSADPQQMWEFPARFLVEFFKNHGMLGLRNRPHWSTVRAGSARYVERLVAPLKLHVSSPIAAIRRLDDGVDVTPSGHESLRFDEVVIATHSDQALALLADPSESERRVLGAIPYQENDAVLHTDARLLPRRRRAWASWNYHHLREPRGRTTITYHMNRLQSLRADREFCVTLNRNESIDPACVIRRLVYQHPIFTPAGVAAQRRLPAISGSRHTHYCGAYWRWGFHEDGVVTGRRVAQALGGERL